MGAVAFMDGWDYLPPAGNNNLLPFFSADGYFGGGAGSGGGFVPATGRFGIGTSMFVGSPPGNIFCTKAMDHRFGGIADTEGWIFGIALQNFGTDTGHFYLQDGQTNTTAMNITINTSGILSVAIAGSTFRSRTGAMRVNAWSYIQVKMTPDLLRVLVNGELAINVVSPPAVPPCDSYAVQNSFSGQSGQTWVIDDMYMIDRDLDGPYDDFLGNVVVRSQLVTGNGSVIQLTANGLGSNWQNVASPVLNVANYNSTDTVGEYDLYALQPNAAARDIFGIQVKGSFSQDNGVQLYAANKIKTGGVEYTGDQFGAQQLPGYATVSNYWAINPGTSAPWTNADLNALEAGPILNASD